MYIVRLSLSVHSRPCEVDTSSNLLSYLLVLVFLLMFFGPMDNLQEIFLKKEAKEHTIIPNY